MRLGDFRAEEPYKDFSAVTPADGADNCLNNSVATETDAIYVGVAGDVTLLDHRGTAVLFKALPVGIHRIRTKRIKSTGTTATNIVALYF